jgi:hypothetical protein
MQMLRGTVSYDTSSSAAPIGCAAAGANSKHFMLQRRCDKQLALQITVTKRPINA